MPINAPIFNKEGMKTGEAELPEIYFGLKWNPDLVAQVVRVQRANERTPAAHVKDRSEVRGGGKKPWRQKGTGRARHGSIRSPIWIGGGVTHGPRKEKVYKLKINKKMAKGALKSVLSAKAKDKEIFLFDSLKFPELKTKNAALLLTNISKNEEFKNLTKGNGAMIALSSEEKKIKRIFKNIPYVKTEEARNLYAYGILNYKYIVFTADSLKELKS